MSSLQIATCLFIFLSALCAPSLADSEELLSGGDLEVGEYCAAYNIQYHYFCRGIWTPDKLRKNRRVLDKISQFCPSYKTACVTRGNKSDEQYDREGKEEHQKTVKEDVDDLSIDDLMRRLQHIVPCRPNCDISKHPHCTRRCKCKYEYKRMKKWCHPGSEGLDDHKYFCKIWYMSCTNYIEDIDPELAEQFIGQYGSSYYG